MDNIIITAADDKYFDSLLTLISSIHQLSIDNISKIIVYDIGLSNNNILKLKKLVKVKIKYIPEEIIKNYPFISDNKNYFFKLWICKESKKYGNNILWLDAGVMCLKDITHMFEMIEIDEIFAVSDVHLNKNFTHKKCINIMNATNSEIEDKQLSSGIIGYKSNGKYNQLFEDAYYYGTLGCSIGDEENHRHDQSVLSILVSRYDAPRQDIDIYGYWTDINRNLQTAKESGAVIFVHRRGYHDIKHLKYI